MTNKGDKSRPGRPVERPLPPHIKDTPENVARIGLNTPPEKRDEWGT